MKKFIETSVFDMFKVGPGPSSSHTMGPMRAGFNFRNHVAHRPENLLQKAEKVQVMLYGSLAATGRGHRTDRAILGGLLGTSPESCPAGYLDSLGNDPKTKYDLHIGHLSVFLNQEDIVFDTQRESLPHSNTMLFQLLAADGEILCSREYYSVGGGTLDWPGHRRQERGTPRHKYGSMKELKQIMERKNLRLVELMIDNERAITGMCEEDIYEKLDHLLQVMANSVDHGLVNEGMLPGPLKYYRKAPGIHRRAKRSAGKSDHFILLMCAYAFAVAEQNAAGEPVVTAPTCGSAGVLAAICYFMKHYLKRDHVTIQDGMMAAAVVGFLAQHNASIAGAEVGCQGEVGVASSMAAALLTYADTSEMRVVENAAQTALEHHLGMTCDPVAGYVQVPCIERNAMGAVKAYTAYLIANTEISAYHRVDLDRTIAAMKQTGCDMLSKYRETALGGLASVVKC